MFTRAIIKIHFYQRDLLFDLRFESTIELLLDVGVNFKKREK